MITIPDTTNPCFLMLPHHTNRTAWRPVSLPIILVIPFSRDAENKKIADSGIVYTNCPRPGLRIYIRDIETSKTPYAGHDNKNKYNPDFNYYQIEISLADLATRKMTISSENSTVLTRSGMASEIEYLPGADYYDLSDLFIPTEQLEPRHYVLVYEVAFKPRIVSDIGVLICIDSDKCAFSRIEFEINHPGEVLNSTVNRTPSLYFDSTSKADDSTIELYKAQFEIIQDVYDEQTFIESINHVNDIRPEYIPYLAYMLNWEMPYYPDSVDKIRNVLLRNISRLQQIKGTKRALVELFDLFGYSILVSNVWWTPDGKAYIGVGDSKEFPVTLMKRAAYEPLILDYAVSGFCQQSIPLIHRPNTKSLFVESFLVEIGSDADQALSAAKTALEDDVDVFRDDNGVLRSPTAIGTEQFPDKDTDGVTGYSKVIINSTGAPATIDSLPWSLHSFDSVRFDYDKNILQYQLNKHVDLTTHRLYSFVSYQYLDMTVDEALTDLRSNRFDISIETKNGEDIRADIIPFLVEYILQIKAFHSLLRKVLYTVETAEAYQVTDLCINGIATYHPDSQIGNIQVPPEAIIPALTGNICIDISATNLGYRPQDLDYRDAIYKAIKDEYESWKRIGKNNKGQDRTSDTLEQVKDFVSPCIIHKDNERTSKPTLDNHDYCYKGRVSDPVVICQDYIGKETWDFAKCDLTLGNGAYYLDNRGVLHKATEGLFRPNFTNVDHVALSVEDLNIKKADLGIPGHRFATMFNLFADFTCDHNKRPWDFDFVICRNPNPNPLNARLSDDKSSIIYDTVPYVIPGNGIQPDIGNLNNNYGGVSPSDVTHAVYGLFANGHISITLENYTAANEEDTILRSPNKSIFDSYSSSEQIDIRAGNPSESAEIADTSQFINPDYFPYMGTDSETMKTTLAVPNTSTGRVHLFYLSSQIRVDQNDINFMKGYRLDCGCSVVAIDSRGIDPLPDTIQIQINNGEWWIPDTGKIKFRPGLYTAEISKYEPSPDGPTYTYLITGAVYHAIDDLDTALTLVYSPGSSENGIYVGNKNIAPASFFLDNHNEPQTIGYISNYIGNPKSCNFTKYTDTNNDQLTYDEVLTPKDIYHAESMLLTETDRIMLELLVSLSGDNYVVNEDGIFISDQRIPLSGNIRYKDDYDIIYELIWETQVSPSGTKFLDLTTTVSDPRQFGIHDRKIRKSKRIAYADGTVTRTRQVYNIINQVMTLTSEGTDQEYGEFPINYLCNKEITDPFALHLDHGMNDILEVSVRNANSTDPFPLNMNAEFLIYLPIEQGQEEFEPIGEV